MTSPHVESRPPPDARHDDASGVAAQGVRGEGTGSDADSRIDEAEGGAYALAFLHRVRSHTAPPDDLAIVVDFPTGPMRGAFCGVVQRALEACHV